MGDNREVSGEFATEIYSFIASKVYSWMRRDDGTPDPYLKQSILDWLNYKLASHPASTDEKALRDLTFDHFWSIVICWSQDMPRVGKLLSVHEIRTLTERLVSITNHALLSHESPKEQA